MLLRKIDGKLKFCTESLVTADDILENRTDKKAKKKLLLRTFSQISNQYSITLIDVQPAHIAEAIRFDV